MQLVIHPEAEGDLARALEHYARIQPELGRRFYHHIVELLSEVAEQPSLFRVWRPPEIRRHFRRPFPYSVVYAIRPDHIRVFAVMHFKQPPDFWKQRQLH